MNHSHTHHEPLLRIAKRDPLPRSKAYAVRVIAVLISLLVSGIFIFSVTKLNPVEVYQSMFKGAYGTNRRMWVTIRDTMMLLCIALGLAPAFKMRFWNIGAEGQVLVGGIATAGLMRSLGTSVPTPLLLIIMACASLICGAVWGMIPAIFKARWNANETLFTLMMNYIAIQLTSYCVALWENPFGSNSVGIINPKTQAGWFPKLFGQANGLNVVIVLLVTIGMYVYLKYSKQGYEIAVVGDSENTARYAGINGHLQRNLRSCRIHRGLRRFPHNFDLNCRWTGIHGDYCCMAVSVQFVHHGSDLASYRLPAEGCRSDRVSVQPE